MLTHQQSVLFCLNKALEAGKDQVAAFFKDSALQITKDAATAVNVCDCYKQLQQQDANNHAMTDADPLYKDMVNRHEAKMREGAPKA